jgi:hypothetical protein
MKPKKPIAWAELDWTDDDLHAAREDILLAYDALWKLYFEYDDVPRVIVDAFESLQGAVDYLKTIDAKRLEQWNALGGSATA